ncbi:MAG: methionyl-tRNA formyltransferase [Chloroflexi bacterium]|nr:methionyl-tRNA formyltransferase [Chloroflexota bacterium]MDA1218647.1 methionyl-tRNA formyltransferase [Chloroflexota bacterium]PKB57231.1 MAG: methionyl-tRNA formyltransferase [SAR202 cluster bacterium Casp-Chloro-G3]
MRLVFMGTPGLVIPVLVALTELEDCQVVGVYTSPDRPRGRGRAQEMTPVKAYAVEHDLSVYQPTTLRSAQAQEQLAALRPDVIVVAAYGRLLPSAVLEMPPHGCLNLHPSLLPRYRGPSPVVTAIKEGEAVTGVTLMLLDEGMDTGPIIAQQEYPIATGDTAESLTSTLFALGAALLVEKLDPWVTGQLTAQPQDNAQATVTRKLERTDGEADWQLSAQKLERLRRAYTPWPGLFTHWQGQVLKLLDVVALPADASIPGEPGLVVALENADTPVAIVTGDGWLGLKTVQLEGRRSASAAEFLRGYPLFTGSHTGAQPEIDA